MRRILFLFTERTGSTLLTAILLGKPMRLNRGDLNRIDFPVWLKTIPKEQCQLYWYSDPKKHIITDIIPANINNEGHEAYTWSPPANLHPKFYDSLPGNNWKFVYLFRDPRNRIESICVRATNMGKNPSSEFRKLMFETQCKYDKYRMNSVLQMQSDPRFYLLRFEDLISSPVKTTKEMFRFLGFEIGEQFYRDVITAQNSRINSSFKDEGCGSNDRWHSWTKEEKKFFDQLAGKELIKLGYETSSDWVKGDK